MIQSAGVIIIDGLNKETEPRVLAVRAYAHWDFPKGCVELGEDLLQAAMRETEEETTLVPIVDYTLTGARAPTIQRSYGKKKKEITYFLAIREGDKTPELPFCYAIGRPENDEFQWLPLSKLPEKMHGPIVEVVCSYLNEWCRVNKNKKI